MGFISGLKGKMAELHTRDILQQNGYTRIEIADDPTQSVWDISAIDSAGEPVAFQVKTGAEAYATHVESALEAQPDMHFMLSSEIYNKIGIDSPEYFEQITDIGPDYVLVSDIDDGLSTLSANMGIDIPDGILETIPYAATIIAAARLMHSVISTEKEFKAADRTTTNKVHIVRTVTLMSRFGVISVLTMAGGFSGVAAGSIAPVGCNLVGGLAGTAGGAVMAIYLNKHLQPRMLDLALSITELTYEDLFYYKNRTRIAKVAIRFHETAGRLAAAN